MTEETIFSVARQKADPAERAAFLDEACAGNPGLRERVEALLRSHEQSGDFLDVPAVERPTDAHLPASAEPPPGARIGPYKLLQQVGEGGMGVVWMAEQLEPIRRRVAVKIIKPGMDSAQVLARFEAERQALALMDHPNIAHVLDAGTTEEGRPFFVMELVKGIPIIRYCDDNGLTPAERLALFVPVCEAVQHAHQKGIIHRDLKPANVLVASYDGKPVPKVIDFGVAKAMGQQLTERTLFTGFGAVIGTLEYMSPEQAEFNALDVDTRSDVYALGVLLYELLAGSTPLPRRRLNEAGLLEAMRVIREEEPPPPSTRLSESKDSLVSISAQRRTEPAQLARLVRGELDWIVMKALDKDRGRRYQTANALAHDLQRYLADEPVEACPPSTSYRLWKFARKNRRLLTTGVAFAVLLLVGVLASTWQAFRATRAEREATAAERIATEQRDEARGAQSRLERSQEELRTTLYAARANLIQSAWEADNARRAVELLELQRPPPGQKDLRGFEWDYWHRLCHADLRTLHLPVHGYTLPTFGPDGESVAGPDSEAKAWVVRVWDTATGNVRRTWKVADIGKDEECECLVSFSADGSRLAAVVSVNVEDGGEDKARRRLVVWEVRTGKELRTIPLKLRDPSHPALAPDGARIAVAGAAGPDADACAGEVQVWSVATGERLLRLSAGCYGGPVFSPDGKHLAAAVGPPKNADAETFRVKVWDAATGKEVLALKPKGLVAGRGLVYSADGKHLAACVLPFARFSDEPGRVQVWDAATGEERLAAPRWSVPQRDQSPGGVVAFSSDGARIAAIGLHRIVKVWDIATRELQFTLKGHTEDVEALAFSRDGSRLYSADIEAVELWDVLAGGRPGSFDAGSGDPTGVAFSPDGTRVASYEAAEEPEPRAADRQEFVVSSLTGGGEVRLEGLGERRCRHLAWQPDGGQIAGVALDSKKPSGIKVQVWDAATGKAVRKRDLRRPGLDVRDAEVRFTADGACLVAVLFVETVERTKGSQFVVHDAATGQDVCAVGGGPGEFTALAFSRDGRRLATIGRPAGANQDQVRLWDVTSGRELHAMKGEFRVNSLAFNPEGRFLSALTDSPPGGLVLWDTATGEVVSVLKTHFEEVRSYAFTPDSRRVALVGTTQTGTEEVTLWDTATGHELLTLSPSNHVIRLHFSPDGHRLLAAVTWNLWQFTKKKMTLTASGAHFDQSFQYTAGRPGTVQVWDATPRPAAAP